ncbi:hypothetical protein ACI6Q5_18435 [Xanthomonas codiaei]|uniref:Uncharacterized protein n=1 Tax=Xanthomonas codiaei TaxID=56463 RepID=A0ABW9MRK1_9XANT|nr:hypothetical protein [Xanthomonas codiaei]
MDFSKVQLGYALLAVNVYGEKPSVKNELNTLQLQDGWTQIDHSMSVTGFVPRLLCDQCTYVMQKVFRKSIAN